MIKQTTWRRRVLSILITAAMVLALLPPLTVSANTPFSGLTIGGFPVDLNGVAGSYSISGNTLTIGPNWVGIGGTLANGETLIVNSTGMNNSRVDSPFINNGEFVVNGDPFNIGAAFTNNGTLTASNTGVITINNNMIVTNTGIINVDRAIILNNGSILNNDNGGIIDINGERILIRSGGTINNNSGGTINSNTLLEIQSGGTLINNSGSIYTGYAPQGGNVTSQPPSAPTNLSVTAGNGDVELSWNAPTNIGGAAIIRYEYSVNDGTWTTTGGTGITFTVTGLTNGTSYNFRVRAVNSAGGGAASNAMNATPIAPTHTATLTVNRDGAPWNDHGKTFTLRQNDMVHFAGTGTGETVAFAEVLAGTYQIFDGNVNTNQQITIGESGPNSAVLDYWSVTLNSAGTAPAGGGNYLEGQTVNINAGEAQQDYQFVNWMTESADVAFDSITSASTSFIMPENAVTVMANFELTDAGAVAQAKAALTWDTIRNENLSENAVTTDLDLPLTGLHGTTIEWHSNNTAIPNTGVITRPSYSDGNASVTLTATISRGDWEDTQVFDLTVIRLEQTNITSVDVSVTVPAKGVATPEEAEAPATQEDPATPEEAEAPATVVTTPVVGGAGTSGGDTELIETVDSTETYDSYDYSGEVELDEEDTPMGHPDYNDTLNFVMIGAIATIIGAGAVGGTILWRKRRLKI